MRARGRRDRRAVRNTQIRFVASALQNFGLLLLGLAALRVVLLPSADPASVSIGLVLGGLVGIVLAHVVLERLEEDDVG